MAGEVGHGLIQVIRSHRFATRPPWSEGTAQPIWEQQSVHIQGVRRLRFRSILNALRRSYLPIKSHFAGGENAWQRFRWYNSRVCQQRQGNG